MFIIDDIILAPAKGFMWIVRELAKAAEQEQASERDGLMRQLQSLHMKLETGAVTQDEFDELEQSILDRLDALAGESPEDATDDDEDEDDGDEHEDEDDDGDEDQDEDADNDDAGPLDAPADEDDTP